MRGRGASRGMEEWKEMRSCSKMCYLFRNFFLLEWDLIKGPAYCSDQLSWNHIDFSSHAGQLTPSSWMTICSLIKPRKLSAFSVAESHREFRHEDIYHILWYIWNLFREISGQNTEREHSRQDKEVHVFLEGNTSYCPCLQRSGQRYWICPSETDAIRPDTGKCLEGQNPRSRLAGSMGIECPGFLGLGSKIFSYVFVKWTLVRKQFHFVNCWEIYWSYATNLSKKKAWIHLWRLQC